MYYKRTSNDVSRTGERNLRVGDVDISDAIGVCKYIAEIPSVSNFVLRAAMSLAVGVEVRSGARATVRVVTKLMDMETMQTGLQALHFAGDYYRTGALQSPKEHEE